MSTQDDASVFFLKLWPRIEANKNRIIIGAVIVAILIFAGWIFAVQSEQKQVEAGEKLTQLIMTPNAKPEAYLAIAKDNPNTKAGQRALLKAAAMMFDSGKFPEAQAQFQKFLDEHADSELAASAALGVATSLDAQNKTDLAINAYRRVINYSDANAVNAAKMGLAEIDEAQGKYNDALAYYQDVMQQSLITSLRQEAQMKLIDLKNKMTITVKPMSPAPSVSPISAKPISPAK